MKIETLKKFIEDNNVGDEQIINVLSTRDGKTFLSLIELVPSDNILQIAIASGRTKVAHFMIDNILLRHIDSQNRSGETALFTAFRVGSWSTVSKLIEKGANLNHIDNYKQNIVSLILFELKLYANNGRFYRGHGALEYAAMFELLLKVKELSPEDIISIEEWIDTSKHGGFHEEPPLNDYNFVCMIERIYTAHKLNPQNHLILDIDKCSDPANDIVNYSLEHAGDKPTICFDALDSLIKRDDESDDYIISLLKQEQNLSLLMQDFRRPTRQNLLHLAIRSHRKRLVKYIIDNTHAIYLESQMLKGNTPLFEAFSLGDFDIAKMLLAKGANINHKSERDGFDLCDLMISRLRDYASFNVLFHSVDVNGFCDTFDLMLKIKNISSSQINDIREWITYAKDKILREGPEVRIRANDPEPMNLEFIEKIERVFEPYSRSIAYTTAM